MKETRKWTNWQREGLETPITGPEQFVGFDGQRPKVLCRTGSKDNINADGWRLFLVQTLRKTLIREPNSLVRTLLRLNKANLRLASAYITEHGHFRYLLATVGLLQEIIVADCGQAPESSKHILLKCKPIDVRRRRIFLSKHPGIKEVAGFGYKILKLVTR